MLVVGIVASVLLAAGLLPPYGEIWKRRGRVIGINWVRRLSSRSVTGGRWAQHLKTDTSAGFPNHGLERRFLLTHGTGYAPIPFSASVKAYSELIETG